MRPPSPPAAELTPRGRFHSRERDARAVRHHYDVPTEFFRLFLGPSMTYSCAIFSRGATTLEEAQEAKHELICQKLGLAARPARARRRLGLGRASRSTPPSATACTSPASRVSPPQVERARWLAEEAGVGDLVDFRLADYRDLAGESYDAVASIGMVEHVGAEQMDEYGRRLRGALRPGGTLLLPRHRATCSRRTRARAPSPRATSSPTARRSRSRGCCSGSSAPASRRTTSRASATTTPRRCAGGRARSTTTSTEATRLAGAERVRVWRLYLRAARNGFETGFTSIYQVRAS